MLTGAGNSTLWEPVSPQEPRELGVGHNSWIDRHSWELDWHWSKFISSQCIPLDTGQKVSLALWATAGLTCEWPKVYTSLLTQPAHQQGLLALHTRGSGHIFLSACVGTLPHHMINALSKKMRACLAGGQKTAAVAGLGGGVWSQHKLVLKTAAGSLWQLGRGRIWVWGSHFLQN